VLLLACPSLSAAPRSAEELVRDYRGLTEQFSSGLAAIPSANRWQPQPPPTGSLVFIATDEYTSEPRGDSGRGRSADSLRLRRARNSHASELFELARRAAQAGQLSLAIQWATEAVREYPDHADARRVLGYEQRDGRWLSRYGARMAESGQTWHSSFGWIVADGAPRYEGGERFVDGRWISAEEDSARHRTMNGGWQLRTDHFLVTTNHSLEAAAELAARLERLHQVWRQLFPGFYLSEREVARLFAGQREPRRQARPFRVYYHRTKAEYVAALRQRQPRIAETLGIYFDTNHEAHFFAGDDQDAGTLYHEAVHQLFQESRPAAKQIGGASNFWVIEGVAAYFETLREHVDPLAGRYFTVGESSAGRLPAARERLVGGFYVPLVQLTQMGKSDFQQHPDIARLYGQSAGLAAFLMHADEGRHREPLVRCLRAVYAGRDNSQSLAEMTGESFEELDRQYRRYLTSLPQHGLP
jgi:hypothetical protein